MNSLIGWVVLTIIYGSNLSNERQRLHDTLGPHHYLHVHCQYLSMVKQIDAFVEAENTVMQCFWVTATLALILNKFTKTRSEHCALLGSNSLSSTMHSPTLNSHVMKIYDVMNIFTGKYLPCISGVFLKI